MKAEELQVGDVLPAPEGTNHGPFIYEVVEVFHGEDVEVFHGEDVVVRIRFFCDGGETARAWSYGQEVSHIRPTTPLTAQQRQDVGIHAATGVDPRHSRETCDKCD